MKKRIVVSGYTALNFGDDLFFKVLFDRYNDHFTLFAPKQYKNIFHHSNYHNVSIENDWSFSQKVVRKLTRSKVKLSKPNSEKPAFLYIEIGGSIFIQSDKWKQSLQLRTEILQNKEHSVILGANFGPYSSIEFFEEYKELFSIYSDVCFRDFYSYNLFSDKNNIRLASDIVLSLDSKRIPADRTNNVIISVINLKNRQNLSQYEITYMNKIIEVVKHIQDIGYNPVLMSFCKAEGDELIIDEIEERLIKEDIKIQKYFYHGNINEALTLIKNSKLVIGTRFHASILAIKFGIPLIPIAYSEKTVNFLSDIGFNNNVYRLSNLNELNIDKVSQTINQCKMDITHLEKSADKQFAYLDNILNKKRK